MRAQRTPPHVFADEGDIGIESSDDEDVSTEHVRVVVRCRPLNVAKEKNGRDQLNICRDGHKIDVSGLVGGDRHYSFTCVADEGRDQAYLFRKTGKPIVECALEGFNGAIVAYGQTGSGKTFTMQGPGLIGKTTQSSKSRGIIQSVCETIFSHVEQCQAESKGITFSVTASYLEIYNENLIDLLVSTNSKKGKKPPKLNIREDSSGGIVVVGQTTVVVNSPDDCYKLLRDGAEHRSVGATKMNSESSRSHAIFTLNIEKEDSEKRTKRKSRLHLVDLAGSERQKGTGATGIRLKEASGINKSLSALGNVVNALSSLEASGKRGAKNIRIPSCRDSKLTFLLKDSLGGNSKLCIIATISPAKASIDETVSTLEFAKRCAAVRNEAVVNEQLTEDIGELQKEVLRLQEANRQLRGDLSKAKATELELRANTNPVVRQTVPEQRGSRGAARDARPKKEVGIQTEEDMERPGEGKDLLKTVKTKELRGALDSLMEGKLVDEDRERRTEKLCILLTNAISREKYHKRKEAEMQRKIEETHGRWMEMLKMNEELNRSVRKYEAEMGELGNEDVGDMEARGAQRMRRAVEVLQSRLENNPEILLLKHRVAALESELEVSKEFGSLTEEGRERYERQVKESQERWLEMVSSNNELMKMLNERDKTLKEVREKGLKNVYGASGERLRREMEAMRAEREGDTELSVLKHRVMALEMELVEFAQLSMEAHREVQEGVSARGSGGGGKIGELLPEGLDFETEVGDGDDVDGLSEGGVLASLGVEGLDAGLEMVEGSDKEEEEGKRIEPGELPSPRGVNGFELLRSLVSSPEFEELEEDEGNGAWICGNAATAMEQSELGPNQWKLDGLRESVHVLEQTWRRVDR